MCEACAEQALRAAELAPSSHPGRKIVNCGMTIGLDSLPLLHFLFQMLQIWRRLRAPPQLEVNSANSGVPWCGDNECAPPCWVAAHMCYEAIGRFAAVTLLRLQIFGSRLI